MSAPHVSGIAALLWSYLSSPTNAQIRSNIEGGADKVGALGQNILAWTKYGRVNLHGALVYKPSGPGDNDTTPPVIGSVSSARLQGTSFEVTWHTNEDTTGTVTFACCGEVRDDSLGTEHCVTFRGKRNIVYEYYVSSTDAAGNTAVAGPFTHQN